MINESKIKCFLSLAETLNFTSTAKALFMSQQAVSKNISRLEDDLGFRLFVRSSHSVDLTKEGKLCYELFSKMAQALYTSLENIRTQYKESLNNLNVGYQVFLDFGTIHALALSELQKEYPDIKMESARYSPSTLNARLLNHQLDLILINGSFAPDLHKLKCLVLTKIPQVLMICYTNSLVSEGATLGTIMHEPLIADLFENESTNDFCIRINHLIRLWGLSPSKIILAPDRDTAYTFAEMGQGYVIGHEMSRIARNRNLKKYFTGKYETLLAVWREDEENALVPKFAHSLLDVYQQT